MHNKNTVSSLAYITVPFGVCLGCSFCLLKCVGEDVGLEAHAMGFMWTVCGSWFSSSTLLRQSLSCFSHAAYSRLAGLQASRWFLSVSHIVSRVQRLQMCTTVSHIFYVDSRIELKSLGLHSLHLHLLTGLKLALLLRLVLNSCLHHTSAEIIGMHSYAWFIVFLLFCF